MNDTLTPHAGASAEALAKVRTPTDHLSVALNGELMIEDCSARDLVAKYGSPLFVVSEATLRGNYRRIAAAFSGEWRNTVRVLYAIKANNNLAVRAILHDEGAGSDCFGVAEMYATFAGGADPTTVVVNGSNKSEPELAKAVSLGVTVNIDDAEEIGVLERLAADAGRRVRVNLRLKVIPPEYSSAASDYFGVTDRLDRYLRREKWGFSVDSAVPLVRAIIESMHLDLTGFSLHVGRVSALPEMYSAWAREAGHMVGRIHAATRYVPRVLDIGGGWARERDPESRSLELNRHPIEVVARAVCRGLERSLAEENVPFPELWLEVGRYIAGNAVCLLGTVGAMKQDLGQTWVNLDCSTNTLMRVDTASSRHHIFPATEMHRPITDIVHIVGPTCIDSLFAESHPMPALRRGDIIVILDTGMYAETTSTQFNGVPRPATVLVSGAEHELIKRRETVEDVFALHRLPERLAIAARGRPD